MPPSSGNGLTPFLNARGMTPPVLNIVRFVMLGGVLFFAALAWFLTSSGQMGAAGNDELAGVLRYVFYGLLVVDLGAMWLVRQRIDRAETFEKKGPLLLIGYALGQLHRTFWGIAFGSPRVRRAGSGERLAFSASLPALRPPLSDVARERNVR